MNQIKRSDSNEQGRNNSSLPKALRQKQLKLRISALKTRQVFLTDNHSDQTKSSNQAKPIDIQRLQQQVRRLENENINLKECILKLKANQFYGINEQKVKNLIRENQNYKSEMRILRNQLQKTMTEKDFLERNNRMLKEKYQQFTKENSKFAINSRLKTEQSRIKGSQLIEDIQHFFNERNTSKSRRSTSSERRKMLKKKVFNNITNKVQEKSNPESKKQVGLSPQINQEYYLLRQAKSNPKRSYP